MQLTEVLVRYLSRNHFYLIKLILINKFTLINKISLYLI